MDVHQLEVFLALSDCLNMTLVAERFFTSRQSVRYTIRSLEQELQAYLVETSGNTLVLTRDGKKLAAMAEQALNSFWSLQYDFVGMASDNPDALTVNVDSALLARRDMLSALYGHLNEQGIKKLTISEEDCEICLRNVSTTAADAAIVRFDRKVFPDCQGTVFNTLRFALLVSKENPLANKRSIDLKDLDGLPLVTPKGFGLRAKNLVTACRSRQISFIRDITASNAETAVDIVSQNLASLVTASNDDEAHDLGECVLVPFDDPQFVWYDCVIYPKGEHNQRGARKIIDFFEANPYCALPSVLL